MTSSEIQVILSLQTANALVKMNEFVGRVGSQLKVLAEEALATWVSFEGIKVLDEGVRSAINLEEAIGRLSEKTGLSVAFITSLRYETESLRISFDDVAVLISKFSSNIYEAATKGGASAEIFERMHVSLTDVNHNLRTTDSILQDTAKWFGANADGAEKARFAQQLFGRAGREIIPLLNEGAAAIAKMRSEGGPITDESVAMAEKFNVQMRSIHLAVEDVYIRIANELLPSLIELSSKLEKFIQDSSNAASVASTLSGLLKGLITVMSVLSLIFYEVGEAIGIASNAIVNNWSVAIKSAIEWVKGWITTLEDVITLLIDMGDAAIRNYQAVLEAATGHFGKARDLISENVTLIKDDLTKVASDVKNNFGVLADATVKIFENDLDGFNQFTSRLKNEWSDLTGFLSSVWKPKAPPKVQPSGGQAKGEFIGNSDDDLKTVAQLDALTKDLYEQRIKLIQADPYKNEREKIEDLLPVMEQFRQQLLAQRAVAEQNLKDSTTDAQKIKNLQQVVKLNGEIVDLEAKQSQLTAKTSVFGDLISQINDLQNKWDSLSHQVVTDTLKIGENISSEIGGALSDVITGTEKWGDATRKVALSIVSTLVHSFVQMGVDYVNQLAMMLAKYVATKVAEGVANNASNVTKTASNQAAMAANIAQMQAGLAAYTATKTAETTATVATNTAKTASNTASAGPAAVTGLFQAGAEGGWIGLAIYAAEIAALIGVVLAVASSSTAREFGGPVVAGQPYIVGERRPELFVPSQNGFILPSVPSGLGGAENVSSERVQNNIMIHFPDSAESANRHARDNSDFHHIIVDIVNKNARTISAR